MHGAETMKPKTNPTDEIRAALDKCEGIEASLIKEVKFLSDSSAELNALQKTIDVWDVAQVQRMTALLTISQVGGPRRTYRHQEAEAAKTALVDCCRGFSTGALAPRLRDIEARTRARVEEKLKPHFPEAEALRSASSHSPELSALALIQQHVVIRDYSPDGALRQAKLLLEAWSAADAFESQYLS
jgi:hypothetical protein